MEVRKIECPCGKRLLVQPEQGLRGKCPRCGRLFDLRSTAPAREVTPPPTRLALPDPVPPARPRSRGALLGWISSALLAVLSLVLATEWLALSGNVAALEERLARIEDAPLPPAAAAPSETTKDASPLTAGTGERPRATPPPASGVRAEDLARLQKELEGLGEELDRLARRVDEARAERGEDPAPPRISAGADDFETRVMALARRVTPSIVSITNGQGTGSGVLISNDGYILTNDHVVSGAGEVTVQLATGDTHNGRVLGSDSYSDIACVKIAARDLPAIELGDSDALSVGQVVAALGNPFGLARDGTPTVTLGIVSALHRVLPLSEDKMYRDAIQTDAAINPGNSGGALVDLSGRLVGINGAITSQTGTNSGIGFAIPVNFVKRVLPALKAGRSTEPGFMGIQVDEMSGEQVDRLGFRGAVISNVTRGSPAERAGLRARDIILRFEGEPIESTTRLLNRISYYQAGETVSVEFWRGGKTQTVSIQIARRSE